MRTVQVFQVDAFTDTPFTGNPAGVVLQAEQLEAAEMQAIARELNNGDTAFVLPPAAEGEDLHVRFFTPRKEAPFVGHATLAVHAVLNSRDPRPLRRQGGATGLVQVRTTDTGAIAISQPAPPLGRAPSDGEVDDVLGLLDLRHEQLDRACPPRIAGSASTRLLLGLRDVAALDAAKPHLASLATLSPRIGAQGYFLFVRTGTEGEAATEARMFCPALGIDEDPVSGNAHAMLGVYLRELGLLPAAQGPAGFVGRQGRHVGRPGRVDVAIELAADGRAVAATISGRAKIVFATEIRLA
ncbi:MAG TPA: PhzF family phenazine biosynthesis isomerase [Steroidobacteraceae bacterium]|nr:PhzF family phenazine biosynthesis isomerase [Steroidobacteraceae bacterium]